MAALLPPKPFKSLPELAALLSARGMAVADSERTERKLGQVGYHDALAYQDSRYMNPKQTRSYEDKRGVSRNRCAHHTRIWNQSTGAPLPLLPVPYFERLSLDAHARTRLLGLVAVVDFLVRQIGPNSTWIRDVADVMDTKPDLPGCGWGALGLVEREGFPRAGFGL